MARFLGFDNVVAARVTGVVADTAWGKIPVSEDSPQGERRLLVRPGGVRLVPLEGRPVEREPAWTVESRTFRGSHVAVRLRPVDGPALDAELPLREAPEEGAAVGVAFRAEDVVVLGDELP